MADGLFYNDLREPHFISDLAPVTLSTTAKALYTTSDVPSMAGTSCDPARRSAFGCSGRSRRR
jgi:hypothetical protein